MIVDLGSLASCIAGFDYVGELDCESGEMISSRFHQQWL